MREIRQIIRAYRQVLSSRESAVLASVVRVQGSAYKGPGARMLVGEDGSACGFLSGGCLEADVLERVHSVLEGAPPTVVRYDMTSPDDILWGLGMGCDGIVDVLLEKVPSQIGPDSLLFLEKALLERQSSVVATVYQDPSGLPVGRRLLLRKDGLVQSGIEQSDLRDAIRRTGFEALRARSTRQMTGSGCRIVLEYVPVRLHLLICGAGYDALPLSSFAAGLGWGVTVADHRPGYAVSDRFPDADSVVEADPEKAAPSLGMDSDTVAVVMTHSFPKDVAWLEWLLSTDVSYIGMLGPRDRLQEALQEVAEGGQGVDDAARRIHGPVGLDIGASSPEEIAVSILAEIRAVLAGRKAGFLRDRKGPISDR